MQYLHKETTAQAFQSEIGPRCYFGGRRVVLLAFKQALLPWHRTNQQARLDPSKSTVVFSMGSVRLLLLLRLKWQNLAGCHQKLSCSDLVKFARELVDLQC